MVRIFSELNLLEVEEWRYGTNREQRQYKRYKKGKQFLTVEIPHKVLQRARVFCDDVTEMQVHWEFELNDLFKVLATNFILWLREQSEPTDVYEGLQNMYQHFKRTYNGVEKNHTHLVGFHRSDYRPVTVELEYGTIHRLEVLLEDMDYLKPKHEYTVENVVSSLLCDYINKLQTDGKGEIKKMVNFILREWGETIEEE